MFPLAESGARSLAWFDLKQAVDAAKGKMRTIPMESVQPIENVSKSFAPAK